MSGTTHVMSRGMEHWHPNPDFFFQLGAGPILDLGPYYVTDLIQPHRPGQARHRLHRHGPHRARGDAPRARTRAPSIKVGTPTTIHGILEFHNGAIVTIGASWDVASHGHHNIELYGTEGSVYVPDPNFFGGDVVTTDRRRRQGARSRRGITRSARPTRTSTSPTRAPTTALPASPT